MNTLALKLIVTPLLIGSVSLAGRRWGAAISGSLVALPLTSIPVVLFLALDHGLPFAATAAVGIVAGTASGAVYCLAYAWLAYRVSWLPAVLGGTCIFAACTWLLQRVSLPLPLLFAGVVAVLLAVLRLLPRQPGTSSEGPSPWWDIPLRVLVATVVVVALTTLAPRLGPQLSGLLTPFPVFTTVLAASAHTFHGPGQAARLLRGVVLGLFGPATCFLIIAVLLTHDGLVATFTLALAATLALQGVSLHLLAQRSA